MTNNRPVTSAETAELHPQPTPEATLANEPPQAERRTFLKLLAATGSSALLLGASQTVQAITPSRQTLDGLKQTGATQTGPNAGQSSGQGKTQQTPKPAVVPATTSKDAQGCTRLQALDFTSRLASVENISQNQLNAHVKLYQGYVQKINAITLELAKFPEASLEGANGTYHPFRELHVEQSFALNGAVLHEYYFGNLGGSRTAPTPKVQAAFGQAFGSWAGYVKRMKALGKSMRGWAITAYNTRDGLIHLYGMDMHHQHVPLGILPLLVLDVYEHAYMIDFGTNRDTYLEAFFDNVDWSVVEQRLQAAAIAVSP
ncbi:MAG: Fe-Mn family superoxide dismutase [Candidatus Melainabacteria bacterium]|nr:Fe-Mn family superoxide dismutase [Candidatus Melainabacteria bacterium]